MFPIMKKVVNSIVCYGIYHVEYKNIEIINQYDKCLICPSHSNIFDPFFIFPKTEELYIIAKSEIFKNKRIAKIWNHYHVFPIKREKNDIKGIRSIIELLEQKEKIKLLIFPEGGILKDNDSRRNVKNGAVFMAATVDLPIIPIFITRAPKVFSKVEVKVGEPIQVKKEAIENKAVLEQESKKLIDSIYNLEKADSNLK